MSDPWVERDEEWSLRYHVPRSQVWEGSRGRQRGNVHLHLPLEPRGHHAIDSVTGRKTTITRHSGSTLCGKDYAWYDRPPTEREREHEKCPRCVTMAERYGVTWPTEHVPSDR